MEDGRALRYEFIVDNDIDEPDSMWLGLGCSMFEMLVALSERMAFEIDGEPREWFWQMLDNVDITHYTDDRYTREVYADVEEVLDRII